MKQSRRINTLTHSLKQRTDFKAGYSESFWNVAIFLIVSIVDCSV